jgi:hypothetical protein
MRQIRPYATIEGAKRALDTGGRFYDLWTRAGDEIIDPAELARAAGVYSANTKAFLHLEMALMDLPAPHRTEVLSLLSPDLKGQLAAKRARVLPPSLVESEGNAGVSAIVTGYPTYVEDRTQLQGFVVMITSGIMVIPIMDQFDVYEVFDTPDHVEPRTVVATVRGSKRLDGLRTRFGGVLKELHFEDKTGKDHGLYLEAMYYTPLE